MSQFDVYRNPSTSSNKRAPFLVEVQGNFCDVIATCVVIPLVVPNRFLPASVLNPTITFEGIGYILSTAEITAVTRAKLGQPVGAVRDRHLEIIQAIDRLLM